MVLKKKSNTFNDYTLEISFGQLEVIMASLERDHSDPVADELYAELQWYQQRVPGPGEEEADVKAREEGSLGPNGQPQPDQEGEDVPLPMPPTEGAADTGEAPPPPPGGEGEFPPEEGAGPEGDLGAGDFPEEEMAAAAGGSPESEGEDLDRLPPPPAE